MADAQAPDAAPAPTVADSVQPLAEGRIGSLRSAGFTDQEIGEWATQQRDTLSKAGFSSDEIDNYFGDKPLPASTAMLSRFDQGAEAHKREGGLLQTIPEFAELIGTPEGRTKLWNAVKQYPSEFMKSMIGEVELPGKVMQGKVDLNTPEGLDQAIGLGALVAFGRPSRLPLNGSTAGAALSTGETFARIDRDPAGNIVQQPIGTLPKPNDFVDAAKAIGGNDVKDGTRAKLVDLYNQQGVHPAEAAADAASDPVIKQSLLSSDPKDIPQAYQTPSPPSELKAGVAEESQKPPEGTQKTEAEPQSAPTEEATAAPTGTSVPSVPLPEANEGGGSPPAPPIEPPAPPESPKGAQQQVLSKISIGGRDARTQWTLSHLYTQAFDDLHPFESIDKDAYVTARLTRGVNGKVDQFLEHGGPFDFNSYAQKGPSLRTILDPVGDDLNGLRAYLVARRAVALEASGKKSGIDLDAANKVIADGGKYADVAKNIAAYQAHVLSYLKDSGVLTKESYDAMTAAGDHYVPFYRVMPEWEKTKGIGKGFGPGNPIKSLKGSDLDIIDPLESIIKNTYAYVSIAERNSAGIKIIDALKRAQDKLPDIAKGVDGLTPETILQVEQLPRPTADVAVRKMLAEAGIDNASDNLVDLVRELAQGPQGETIGAFRNGVRETYKVTDPDLLGAFRALDRNNVDMLTKVLAVPARMLRAGATVTPDFIVRNLVRDFMSAFVYTGNTVFHPLDTVKGMIGTIGKDADFQNWLKAGGGNATLVALDRRYMQESLRKLSNDTGLMRRAWNVVTSPLIGLRMLSELAENATRLGEFKKLTRGGPMTKDALQQAAFGSREVTLDFARIGASMRSYNMITAFLNANLQGGDRMIRAFRDAPVATSVKVAGGITLPSVLLWWANHDDPRYKEIPDWERDLFWIVMTKDHIYRIPKPFELGVAFGSGAERALDAYFGQNPDAYKDFANSVSQALLPNFTPTFMTPIIEQFANRSTFADRTLIPDALEKQLPEYRYTPYTTELAKALGRIVSDVPGIREAAIAPDSNAVSGIARAASTPILMENYVRAWTGGLGTYALGMADDGLRKAGVLPDPVVPTPTLADIPFVKAFVVRYPSASTQSIQDFYDQYTKNKMFFDTFQAQAKAGNMAAVQRVQQAGGPQIFIQLSAIQQALSVQSKVVSDVYKNPTIDPDQKRQLIDSTYSGMIALARAGNNAMQQIEQSARSGQKVH